MTNFEIITREALNQKIFTPEEAAMYLNEGLALPLHTFQEWYNLGYSVRKGEKAKMACKVWKYSSKKVTTQEQDQTTEEAEQEGGHFYLANAYFFTREQVEQIKEV